ncbi:MAG: hypothetical protein JNM40_02635 [Myxococcales bacterium]|nr:hypothetical protein [Myxococcales bacterium]
MHTRLFRFGMLSLGLVGFFGCSQLDADIPQTAMGKAYSYPLDDALFLQHIQVRGTHNSYHIDTNEGRVEPWQYTHAPIYDQLDRLGIRQLELDVSYDAVEGLSVLHVPYVDTGTHCARFLDCLREIRRFSAAYPGHLPIFIQIEPKANIPTDEMESFFGSLEGEILSVFPAQSVITPDEVRGDAKTLREAVQNRGWPKLRQLRGRVLFVFDTTGPTRTAYTHNKKDLNGRLLFVDSGPSDPFGAISVLNDPVGNAAAIAQAVRANFLVRTRADADTVEARKGDTGRAQAALQSGSHFISTDFPEENSGFPYRFVVPAGRPARCNPLIAPKECTPLALEDPAFVGSYIP